MAKRKGKVYEITDVTSKGEFTHFIKATSKKDAIKKHYGII